MVIACSPKYAREVEGFDIAEARPGRRAAGGRPRRWSAVARWTAEQVTPSATGDAALWLTRLVG
jgi:hypothetical protein